MIIGQSWPDVARVIAADKSDSLVLGNKVFQAVPAALAPKVVFVISTTSCPPLVRPTSNAVVGIIVEPKGLLIWVVQPLPPQLVAKGQVRPFWVSMSMRFVTSGTPAFSEMS